MTPVPKDNNALIPPIVFLITLKEADMNLVDVCIAGLVIIRSAVSLIVEALNLFCTYLLVFYA